MVLVLAHVFAEAYHLRSASFPGNIEVGHFDSGCRTRFVDNRPHGFHHEFVFVFWNGKNFRFRVVEASPLPRRSVIRTRGIASNRCHRANLP